MTGLSTNVLRQWEAKIPQLNPRRSRKSQRYYLADDIDVVRRVKYFVRHEKMTLEGARLRLAQELHGEGRPRTSQEAIDLVDELEQEVRAMLDLLDSVRGDKDKEDD